MDSKKEAMASEAGKQIQALQMLSLVKSGLRAGVALDAIVAALELEVNMANNRFRDAEEAFFAAHGAE